MRFARWTMNGLVGLALLVVLAAVMPMPGQAQVSVLNYFSQATGNDNALVLGGTVTRFGVTLNGVTSGTATLDGLNPTVVTPSAFTTGLVHCVVTHESNAAPGDDPNYLTVMSTTGVTYFEVYAWKNTSGTDPTYVASTDSDDTFNWICTGN